MFSPCRDLCRTQAFLSPIPLATLRVGFELLSSFVCVSYGQRNSSLRPLLHVRAFSPVVDLLCPRLTSANSSRHLSVPVVRDKLTDLPGYCALTFALMPAAYTYKLSVQVLDFRDTGLLIQFACLICDFCSSSRCFAAASFRFHLAMDTLAVRLTIPPVGFVGDFHSLVSAPCRAHEEKRRDKARL